MLLTPETSIRAQKDLGADIIIPFDELPPYHIDADVLKKSFDRTHRWQERSLNEHLKDPQGQKMYAVIHGGVDNGLRKKSCEILSSLDFDGFSIGGSMGKTKDEMFTMLNLCVPNLPTDAPKHLLGIGDLSSLDALIPLGIDTFDSSYPTKLARHGIALTHSGPCNLKRGANKACFEPISGDCECYTCKHYSLAYLHHLAKAKELSFYTLATIHNLAFMCEKMQLVREAILEDKI